MKMCHLMGGVGCQRTLQEGTQQGAEPRVAGACRQDWDAPTLHDQVKLNKQPCQHIVQVQYIAIG
jgi:hypothetical protein